MHCRFCDEPLLHLFVDLGRQPSANRFLSEAQLDRPEPAYPLRAYVCHKCHLVQLADDHGAETVFDGDYVYFSSYSGSAVDHARRYADMAMERFGLGKQSFVVEVASNDGYLLQNFVAKGVPCLGIDPAAETAKAAREKGVETRIDYFGRATAEAVLAERGGADLVLGNNVLAHVPDLNDFVAGLAALIKPDGVLTVEFPHLLRLIEDCQFDTIYDEHFSYFSFTTVCAVFHHHGLDVFDVEELPIHGGSLRVFANRPNRRPVSERVGALIAAERPAGIGILERYLGFQDRADAVRDAFCALVADEKAKGRRLAAFGAAAKGNTFLNFCGVGADVLDYVVDDTPAKQGKYLPGSRVPVVTRKRIGDTRPDAIVILPWNFKAEIIRSLSYTREWGCRLVTCIPRIEII